MLFSQEFLDEKQNNSHVLAVGTFNGTVTNRDHKDKHRGFWHVLFDDGDKMKVQLQPIRKRFVNAETPQNTSNHMAY
jgi:hypothetical protein